jgi:aspartate-semialdehyde dehydrogenase
LASRATVALVGSESLLGREVRDVAATRDSGFTLRFIATAEEEANRLTRQGDEPAIVSELSEDSFAGVGAVFLAGPAESSHKALELCGDTPVIDLTGAAEDRADARLRAPMVESEEEPEEGAGSVHVIAHPAAIALALFLRRLQANDPIRRAVVEVLLPASEHGQAGVEELQQQTVNLLSFKSLPKAVFDAQAGFNLLPRYGEEAPVPLEETEVRIERHLATLLALAGDGEGAPLPSLRVVQAPVFHGCSISAWVEFESNPGVDALEQSLATGLIDVRGEDVEPPTNVGCAGQDGIAVGAIVPDRNDAEACWFWLVADNLRLVAENAVAVAGQLV